MKTGGGLIWFIALTVFGLSLFGIAQWLFPFLPAIGWLAVALGTTLLAQTFVIRYLGRHYERLIASRDTGLHLQLRNAQSTIRELTANRPLVNLSFDLTDLFRDHAHIEIDNYQRVILRNEGPVTVFEVTISEIDLGDGWRVEFDLVPRLGIEERLIDANVTFEGLPVPLGSHDLAQALFRSVNSKAEAAFALDLAQITYPIILRFRDVGGRWFESLCEIRAYGQPLYQTVTIVFKAVNEVGAV
jgi:hypothetical protein